MTTEPTLSLPTPFPELESCFPPGGPAGTTSVTLLFLPGEDLPRGECLAAVPVDADELGGVHRLTNTSFFVPLSVGDLVATQRNGDGALQVVDIVGPVPALLTGFACDEALSEEDRRAMLARWQRGGAAWTEGTCGLLRTTWPHLDEADVAPVLEDDEADHHGEWLEVWAPEDRQREAMPEVDFRLDLVRHLDEHCPEDDD